MSSKNIKKILQLSFSEFSVLFHPTALTLTEEDIEQELKKWITLHKGNKPIACIKWDFDGLYYTFSYLGVIPKYRNKGYGTKLVTLVENNAKCNGCNIGRVLIRSTLSQNIKFVESLGYKFTSPYGENLNYWVFQKSLEELTNE